MNSDTQKPEWSLSAAAKGGEASRAGLLENHLYGDIRRGGDAVLEAHFHKASPDMRLVYFILTMLLLSSTYFFIVIILSGRKIKMMRPHTYDIRKTLEANTQETVPHIQLFLRLPILPISKMQFFFSLLGVTSSNI